VKTGINESAAILPLDHEAGTLVGRVWIQEPLPGPRTCVLQGDTLHDLSALAPTLSDLFDLDEPAARVRGHDGARLCSLAEAVDTGRLLAPCDLQALKAAGVTFADSLIERVIEERGRGDATASERLRAELTTAFGGSLDSIKPGSPEAMEAKRVFIDNGLWSQYLEVGIGRDAEIFTKGQPLSAVGCGAAIGIRPDSTWSVSEPEIVLAVSSAGNIVGATLGNDLTLRDYEGRSALLLAKAKDNNASCAIGPFVRLFDDSFDLAHLRTAEVHLEVEGRDGFSVEGTNSLGGISRDPHDLVGSTLDSLHQYPDGLMLFLGTMFVPTADRQGPGSGFTHRVGDIVRISSPSLGVLQNAVTTSDAAPPWEFGIRALAQSLAARGLLAGTHRFQTHASCGDRNDKATL
jgi:fumarylacetoacetate (FAA) hydrolase family protein